MKYVPSKASGPPIALSKIFTSRVYWRQACCTTLTVAVPPRNEMKKELTQEKMSCRVLNDTAELGEGQDNTKFLI